MSIQLTSGEGRMLRHAREDAQAVSNLLNEPVGPEDVREAMRRLRTASAGLQYIEERVRGNAAPRAGD